MTNILANLERKISMLPDDVQSIIFYYIPTAGTAKVIKRVIDTYKEDHSHSLTKQYRLYFVSNILSFYQYWRDSNYNSEDYDYGPYVYSPYLIEDGHENS